MANNYPKQYLPDLPQASNYMVAPANKLGYDFVTSYNSCLCTGFHKMFSITEGSKRIVNCCITFPDTSRVNNTPFTSSLVHDIHYVQKNQPILITVINIFTNNRSITNLISSKCIHYHMKSTISSNIFPIRSPKISHRKMLYHLWP